MCEAAEVLRLSARTVREYARRSEIRREKSLENGGHYDAQTLTPSSKTRPSFSYICLPFLNFHSLLLTFGGGFPNPRRAERLLCIESEVRSADALRELFTRSCKIKDLRASG